MSRIGWDLKLAFAVMVIVGVAGQFLPHHLPGWYRVMVIGLAVVIWLVLVERPPSRDS